MNALALLVAMSLSAEPSRFSFGARAMGALSLTPSRTQGGVGGGLSVAFALTPSWQLQGDAIWLGGIGSNGLFRLGGGWARAGTWRPLVRVDLELGVGQALNFGTSDHPPTYGPSLGVTASVALIRFAVGLVVLSALEIGGGIGTEFSSVGPRVNVTLFSVSTR